MFPAGINDLFDFLFFEPVDFDRRWRVLGLTRDRVLSGRAEQADIKHRVDPHTGR